MWNVIFCEMGDGAGCDETAASRPGEGFEVTNKGKVYVLYLLWPVNFDHRSVRWTSPNLLSPCAKGGAPPRTRTLLFCIQRTSYVDKIPVKKLTLFWWAASLKPRKNSKQPRSYSSPVSIDQQVKYLQVNLLFVWKAFTMSRELNEAQNASVGATVGTLEVR